MATRGPWKARGERPLRIANCSGFYGDRLAAPRELLEGGPLDFLTGDYLAELTMLILGKDQLKDPTLGYARTFVTQRRNRADLDLVAAGPDADRWLDIAQAFAGPSGEGRAPRE